MKISTLLLAALPLVAAIPPAQGQTILDPQWGFSFQVPAGWKHQHDATGAILGHETIPGMLIVLPHTVGTIEELESLMQQGLEEEGITFSLSGQISPAGKSTLSANYEGEYRVSRFGRKGTDCFRRRAAARMSLPSARPRILGKSWKPPPTPSSAACGTRGLMAESEAPASRAALSAHGSR